MQVIFTLCSNNYLAQALTLARSVKRADPDAVFLIGLVDRKDPAIDYDSFPCEVLEAKNIDPSIDDLAKKFSIIELNTCLKPTFFEFIFDHYKASSIIYLDPDMYLYRKLEKTKSLFENADFLITPHILSPIPLDDFKPREELFLNYGLYNLGFLGLKNGMPGRKFLRWWKERTYQKGYNRPAEGLFTDQLWINYLPLFFKQCHIIDDPGFNMGPWNLHERYLAGEKSNFLVNAENPLVFFHFSGFTPGIKKFHWDYNRFPWDSRPDLRPLYDAYCRELETEGFSKYKEITCVYSVIRETHLLEEAKKKEFENELLIRNKPAYQRFVRFCRKIVNLKSKEKIQYLVNF